MPTDGEKLGLLKNRLARFSKTKGVNFEQLLQSINGLSHAEISLACFDAIKETILNEKIKMSNDLILKSIKDRDNAYHQ